MEREVLCCAQTYNEPSSALPLWEQANSWKPPPRSCAPAPAAQTPRSVVGGGDRQGETEVQGINWEQLWRSSWSLPTDVSTPRSPVSFSPLTLSFLSHSLTCPNSAHTHSWIPHLYQFPSFLFTLESIFLFSMCDCSRALHCSCTGLFLTRRTNSWVFKPRGLTRSHRITPRAASSHQAP